MRKLHLLPKSGGRAFRFRGQELLFSEPEASAPKLAEAEPSGSDHFLLVFLVITITALLHIDSVEDDTETMDMVSLGKFVDLLEKGFFGLIRTHDIDRSI